MIVPVDAEVAAELGAMTHADHRQLLPQVSKEGPLLAWHDHDFGRPIGYVLARVEPGGSAELLSIYVQPSLRRQGRASRLLAQAEEAARAARCTAMACDFAVAGRRAPRTSALLRKGGWSEPQVRALTLELGRELGEQRWVRWARARAGAQLCPWPELTETERAIAGCPAADAELSFGLRVREGLAGWIAAERLGPQRLRVCALEVRADFRFPDRAALLLARAAQALGQGVVAEAEIPAELRFAELARLARGKLAPVARRFHERWRAEKPLA